MSKILKSKLTPLILVGLVLVSLIYFLLKEPWSEPSDPSASNAVVLKSEVKKESHKTESVKPDLKVKATKSSPKKEEAKPVEVSKPQVDVPKPSDWASQSPKSKTPKEAKRTFPELSSDLNDLLKNGEGYYDKNFAKGGGWAGEMRKISVGLGQTDPEGGVDLLLQIPKSNTQKTLMQGLFSAWSRNDPRSASRSAAELQDPGLKYNSVSAIAYQWSIQEPEGAANWTKNMEDGPARDRAVETVAKNWGYKSPEETKEWVDGLANKDQAKALLALIRSWAETDPIAAAAALDELPASDEKTELTRYLIPLLFPRDSTKALELLDGLGKAPENDGVFYQVGFIWLRKEPAQAMDWVKIRLGQGNRSQKKLFDRLYASWNRKSPKLAEEWLKIQK